MCHCRRRFQKASSSSIVSGSSGGCHLVIADQKQATQSFKNNTYEPRQYQDSNISEMTIDETPPVQYYDYNAPKAVMTSHDGQEDQYEYTECEKMADDEDDIVYEETIDDGQDEHLYEEVV